MGSVTSPLLPSVAFVRWLLLRQHGQQALREYCQPNPYPSMPVRCTDISSSLDGCGKVTLCGGRAGVGARLAPADLTGNDVLAKVAVAQFSERLAALTRTKESIRNTAAFVREQAARGFGKRLIQKLVEFISKVLLSSRPTPHCVTAESIMSSSLRPCSLMPQSLVQHSHDNARGRKGGDRHLG